MKLRPGIITGGSSSSGTGGSSGGSGGSIIPSFVAAGVRAKGSGSVTVAYPAGVVTDDVLLLLQETAGGDAAPIAPATWTQVTNSPSADTTGVSSGQTRISVFWKRYNGAGSDAAESLSGVYLSDAGDHQFCIIVAFRNCYLTGNPWDTTAASSAGSATAAISVPTVTTSGTNRLIVAIASTSYEADTTTEFSGWTNAALTGITEIVDFTESNGDGGGIGAAYGFKATAGATGATTATAAHAERHAYLTIALKGQTG